MRYMLEFLLIYFFILVLGYLIPAGLNYWLYFVRVPDVRPIQNRRPTRAQILREIKLSLISVVIFSLMATVVLELYWAGRTRIYWGRAPYPPLYFFASIFFCMVIHDTYFYWSHRFMHWRPVFKFIHAAHHRSISPTPWAIYAFSPAEAVLQFLVFGLIVVFVPLHPLALLLFLFLDTQMNTGGHTGYELVPGSISKHPLYQGLNTVTHHDSHHTNMTKNFGSFFNVWDRWMGTFEESPHEPEREKLTYHRADERQTCKIS